MLLEKNWVDTLQINLKVFSIDQTKASTMTPLMQQLFVSGITPGHFTRCVNQVAQLCNLHVSIVKKLLQHVMKKKEGFILLVLL
jgi:hypothetical protein